MTLPPLPPVDDHWMTNDHRYTADKMHAYARASLAQTGAEPVAQIERDGLVWLDTNPYRLPIGTKLYLSPAAQPAPPDAAGWWALVMGAAASLEDAANCLRDPDAKRQAEGAAKHYREAAKLAWSQRAAPLPAREPVACVTECEACFTPDACQLRGTCDHYAASQLRIAPTAQPAPQWIGAGPEGAVVCRACGRPPESQRAALAQTGAEPVAVVYPPDGTVSPFTVINLGAGRVQMGDSIHDRRLPALWFGKNGQGMGHEEEMNREAREGETLAVVTFANVEGLDVLVDVIQRIRRVSFPDAAPTAQPAPLPAPPATKADRVHAIVNAGPFPGMSEAFDLHMGAACWTDPAYAPDASTWAAAWKAAAPLPAREPQPPEDWAVYSQGACVADGITWAEAFDYLTPARLERGWSAVCVATNSNITATPAAQGDAL